MNYIYIVEEFYGNSSSGLCAAFTKKRDAQKYVETSYRKDIIVVTRIRETDQQRYIYDVEEFLK